MGSLGCKGFQEVIGVTTGYKRLPEETPRLTKVTWGYRGYKGLEKVTRDYKRLQGVTKGYRRLQGVTRGYKGLQGATRLYRELQKVK